MLPAERGEILEQLRVEGLIVSSEGLDRPLEVHGIQSAMAAVARVRPLAR